MRVCVCGGTNPGTNPKFLEGYEEIGELLCQHDFELVWGGNKFGVLAAIHQAYIKNNKPNTLILPKPYLDDLNGMITDKVMLVDTINDRQDAMMHNSDVIVFVPGGIGTTYEFWTCVECLRCGEINNKLILYNHNNFWGKQIEFMNFINENGFTKTGVGGAPYKVTPEELFTVVNNPQELIAALLKIKK